MHRACRSWSAARRCVASLVANDRLRRARLHGRRGAIERAAGAAAGRRVGARADVERQAAQVQHAVLGYLAALVQRGGDRAARGDHALAGASRRRVGFS